MAILYWEYQYFHLELQHLQGPHRGVDPPTATLRLYAGPQANGFSGEGSGRHGRWWREGDLLYVCFHCRGGCGAVRISARRAHLQHSSTRELLELRLAHLQQSSTTECLPMRREA